MRATRSKEMTFVALASSINYKKNIYFKTLKHSKNRINVVEILSTLQEVPAFY